MWKPAAAALLLAACTDAPTLDRADRPIIGGRTAQPSEYPTVVALENGPGNWFCTGTLVHATWVLTAAHCVEGETAASLKIRFDDADVNDSGGGREVAVAAVHAHPGYDGVAWDNDIAVVELAEAITDRTPTPVHRASPAAGTTHEQVGYGDADDRGGGAGILRMVENVSIDCADANDPTVSGANMLCFTPIGTGRGTCYGDSGGPSFVTTATGREVAGVTSGGTVDSCLDGYDLETLVIAEIDFVDEYVPLTGGPDPDPDPDPDPSGDGESSGGCSTGGPAGLGAALALLALRRRRRRHA